MAGHLTIETLDRTHVLTVFDRFVDREGAPCAVLVEVAPETKVAPLAEGVIHYVLRRLLASASADVRIVGEVACIGPKSPAYLRTATATGSLRLFGSLNEALSAPSAGYTLAA